MTHRKYYHHHVGVNTWHSKGASPAARSGVGLDHTAIRYRAKRSAIILERLLQARYPLSGASDHGVSEALCLNDLDNNGVELYWTGRRNHGNIMRMVQLSW